MTLSGTPSWASSTAWAWRSWWGANRRRTPAFEATRRSWARAASLAQGRPRVGPSITHSSGPTGIPIRNSSQGLGCSPAPRVHADLAAPAALAVADEHRSRARVEVVLADGECLVDAESRAPEQHDQRTHARAVGSFASLAHGRHDLLDRGRIGRVAQPLVARRAPGQIAGQRDGRATAAGRHSATAARTWTLLPGTTGSPANYTAPVSSPRSDPKPPTVGSRRRSPRCSITIPALARAPIACPRTPAARPSRAFSRLSPETLATTRREELRSGEVRSDGEPCRSAPPLWFQAPRSSASSAAPAGPGAAVMPNA